MPPPNLTPLQRDIVRAFFERETRFYLTGGAALVMQLGHRTTEDVDLFTLENILDDGIHALEAAALAIGAMAERKDEHRHLRRVTVHRGEESVKVELVHEVVEQVTPRKPVINGIPRDPPEEIMANKLCALLGRAVARDLIDLRALEGLGLRVEDALPAAMRKDSGLSVEVLVWALREFPPIAADELPETVTYAELEAYRRDLIVRLARLAFPR